jgi:predicted DNA-binding protein with PD1-like motif
MTGTLSASGVHLHMSLSDSNGRAIGGHVTDGCIVYTTAEIVIVDLVDLEFRRAHDPKTGYRELTIRQLGP